MKTLTVEHINSLSDRYPDAAEIDGIPCAGEWPGWLVTYQATDASGRHDSALPGECRMFLPDETGCGHASKLNDGWHLGEDWPRDLDELAEWLAPLYARDLDEDERMADGMEAARIVLGIGTEG